MFRFILSVFIFLFSFNFLFAANESEIKKLINDYKKNVKGAQISIISKTFNTGSNKYNAFILSSYNLNDENSYYQYDYKNTTVYICSADNDILSNCKNINLYKLRIMNEDTAIAVSKNYITFEINGGDMKYYLTLKEKNGEFYLHKFTRAYYLNEFSGDKEIVDQLSSDEASNNYKIKMEDITFEDLMPVKMPVLLLKDYPALKYDIYDAVSSYEGDNINSKTAEFKVGSKSFTAIALTSSYMDYQLPSHTDSWCQSTGSIAFICDGTGKNISNCRKGGFNTSATCGSAYIVTKDEYITFETSGQNRRGIETYNYTTYRYINGDFYLHKDSTLEHDVDDEETAGETTIHYSAKGKYDTLFAN